MLKTKLGEYKIETDLELGATQYEATTILKTIPDIDTDGQLWFNKSEASKHILNLVAGQRPKGGGPVRPGGIQNRRKSCYVPPPAPRPIGGNRRKSVSIFERDRPPPRRNSTYGDVRNPRYDR